MTATLLPIMAVFFFCIDNGVSEAAADTSLNAEAEEQSLSDTLANERMNEAWMDSLRIMVRF